MPMPGVKPEMFPKIAELLGISVSHVWDLASDDQEIASTLSIRQVQKLSSCTGIGILDLIGLKATNATQPITVDDLCNAIKTRISDGDSGIPEFEDAVGWGVDGFLHDPARLYDIANWQCLRDIACSVGIDPIAVLPRDNQPTK